MKRHFINYQKEISDIFGFELSPIEFLVAKDRSEYNDFIGKETATWQVGRALKDGRVLVLDPKVWPKYAPGHRPEEFPLLVKHEMIHVYTRKLTDKDIPAWLTEGLAGALSGQAEQIRTREVPDDFCRKFESFEKWNENVKLGAYPVSFKFVNYLVSKYGFEKIKELISKAPQKYHYEAWDNTSMKVFKKSLRELEKEFTEQL